MIPMIPMIPMKGTVLIRIRLVLEAWEAGSPLVAAAAQAMENHRQGRRLLLGALPQAEMLPARLFRGKAGIYDNGIAAANCSNY